MSFIEVVTGTVTGKIGLAKVIFGVVLIVLGDADRGISEITEGLGFLGLRRAIGNKV